MNLNLTEEQEILRTTVSRYVRDHYSVEQRRRIRDTQAGFDTSRWAEFAEMGWLAITFAEKDGGFGGTMADLIVIMRELGRGLVAEPYLINVAICGRFLASGTDKQRARYIPDLIEGLTQWAFAFAEPQSGYHLTRTAFSAVAHENHFKLNGDKIAVINGHVADHYLVLTRTAGEVGDSEGLSLMIVDAKTPGLTCSTCQLVDGTKGAHLTFSDVQVDCDQIIGNLGDVLSLVESVVAQAVLAIGAEALGAADALLEQTVEYTKTREQFGHPISQFQALQHRMAEMYMSKRSLEAILNYATIAQDQQQADASAWASAVKVKTGEVGRFISQQAVQLHGGIGITDELAVGHYFKRLLLLNTLFGDSEYHLARFAEKRAKQD